MTTSVTPKERRRERAISSSVRPATSTNALGQLSVSGRKRVPRPAARIIAFTRSWPSFAQTFQTKMPNYYIDSVGSAQLFCCLLRQIDRAMLPSGAAERDHEILEAAALIIRHTQVHKRHGAG